MRLLAVFTSAGAHAALILALDTLPLREAQASSRIVEMRVEKPKPPPPPEPEKAPEPPPPPEVKPKLVPKRTVEKVVKDEPKPAEPPPPPSEPPPPPPMGFSVEMSNTVGEGGVAVQAVEGGGNMFADPNDKTRAPGQKTSAPPPPEPAGRGRGTAPAGSYQITRMPEFAIPEVERTPPYPEAAKERQVEGQVLLSVYVGESGRVEQVKIVQRLDPSCDEAAVRWVKERWRFKPALAGDEPVAMWIPAEVTFVLER